MVVLAGTVAADPVQRRMPSGDEVADDIPAATVLEKMTGPDVVESLEDYSFGYELVMKGQRLRNSHPLVRQYPDCFRAVGA